MQNVDEAKRAVEELHDKPFMGRNLVVNGANNKPKEDRPPRERKPREDGQRENKPTQERKERRERPTTSKSKLHINNLSYDADENAIEDLFKGVGAVRRVEIVYNRQTHRSKGFGFVEMRNIDDAKRAIEVLHDQPFLGRKISVSLASEQAQENNNAEPEAKVTEETSVEPVAETVTPEPVIETPVIEETPVEAPVETQESAAAEAAPEPTPEVTPEPAPEPVSDETPEAAPEPTEEEKKDATVVSAE